MAHWNYKDGKTHYYPAHKEKEGWYTIDCGCSGGIQWGGNEPIECDRCGGTGSIWWHKKSKAFAQYPGGHFKGRGELTKLELEGGAF